MYGGRMLKRLRGMDQALSLYRQMIGPMNPRSRWAGLCDEIREETRLRTYPVSVTMLRSNRYLAESNDVKLLGRTGICQMLAKARYLRHQGVVGASAEGIKCLWADACLGMVRSPDRFREGDLNLPFTNDVRAAKNLQETLFAIGNDSKPYTGVVAAPLDLAKLEPDVIVIYATPGQTLKVLMGLAYQEGEAPGNHVSGQASVCQCIARTLHSGMVCVDISCVGDRRYGLVQDDEMLITIPAGKLEQVVRGMKASDPFASYPFSPFLGFNVLFPPDYEPTANELDKE